MLGPESSETIVGLSRPRLQFQKSQGRDWDRDYNLLSLNIETEIWKVSTSRLIPKVRFVQQWDQKEKYSLFLFIESHTSNTPAYYFTFVWNLYYFFYNLSSFQSHFNCKTRQYQRYWDQYFTFTKLSRSRLNETINVRDFFESLTFHCCELLSKQLFLPDW